ncbi:Protein of unknown function [Bacillus mycoides]|uniref:Uncharacterized protein n=3 Tax=Bacillus cereus group TaxID=86661 RepID=A0A1C4DR77_BACTU|nr:Protein of unknown function [Bacillus mycoides]SCC33876.1 Protein of unknown function [Bacillus thuringiensis]SCC42391.1 Protein of unknown function [Bacillus wiedmannii]SCB68284.1 Protein of unknown function [Bacillus mycoides]SCC28789.1 Protein of unknown function [Bacillus mycoides]
MMIPWDKRVYIVSR